VREETNVKLTMTDHEFCLRACADRRATDEEREFLSFMASLAAACEPVTAEQYRRVQVLTGGGLSTTTPIFDRPHKP
jgi:hypothetical protein